MDMVPGRPGFSYKERVVTYHSVSCVCRPCLNVDARVPLIIPMKEIRFRQFSKPAVTYTGKTIDG